MKIRIEKEDLLEAVNAVLKAIAAKTTMQILECIYISANEDGVVLIGNNISLGIEVSITDGCVDDYGEVAVEARIFAEIVKKLPNAVVKITADDKFNLVIECENSRFKIRGQDPTLYPQLPCVGNQNKFSVKGSLLKAMINKVIFAVDENNSKPIFTGALIKAEKGELNMVAVDGFRIAHSFTKSDAAEQAFSVIIPGQTLKEISKLLKDTQDIEICFTENHIIFELGSCTVVSTTIGAEFIEYEKSFPTNASTTVTVNREELILCLQRACVVGIDDSKKTKVNLNITDERMTITAETEKGESTEEILIDNEGDDLKISFNSRFLIDALKNIDSGEGEVIINFGKATNPCVIKAAHKAEDCRHLILPLRNLDLQEAD